MAIWLDENSRILVQGMTGSEGTKHTRLMVKSGAQIVAGVTPGKAGQDVDGIPIFNDVAAAMADTGANVSVVFVPPRFAKAAVIEAIDAEMALCVVITEGIPVHDTAAFFQYSVNSGATRIIGPNCPGIVSPGKCKIGILPYYIHRPGRVGVISRSGTLTYEAVDQLTKLGLGQSTCIGIGGDPVVGTTFVDALAAFQADPDTDAVLMIGEIGGTAEEEAARFVKEHLTKPVAAFIAGQTAPPGKRMGHAGAIIAGGKGTAAEKVAALQAAGIVVSDSPAGMGVALKAALGKGR